MGDVKNPSTLTRFGFGAIIAGSILSVALTLVLLQFGSAMGLSASAPLRGEASIAAWGVIAAGIWLLWVQLLSSLAGGYVAGRLRLTDASYEAHEQEMRDGIAGLMSWALATVLVFAGVAVASAFITITSIMTDSYTAPGALTAGEQNKAVIFAFVAGATSLLSAVAAWWAGTMGGDHRDNNRDFSAELSFRAK
jgi:hypothetical protein